MQQSKHNAYHCVNNTSTLALHTHYTLIGIPHRSDRYSTSIFLDVAAASRRRRTYASALTSPQRYVGVARMRHALILVSHQDRRSESHRSALTIRSSALTSPQRHVGVAHMRHAFHLDILHQEGRRSVRRRRTYASRPDLGILHQDRQSESFID